MVVANPPGTLRRRKVGPVIEVAFCLCCATGPERRGALRSADRSDLNKHMKIHKREALDLAEAEAGAGQAASLRYTQQCLREFLEELIIARYEPVSILLDTLVSDRLGPYTLCVRAMNGMIDRVYRHPVPSYGRLQGEFSSLD